MRWAVSRTIERGIMLRIKGWVRGGRLRVAEPDDEYYAAEWREIAEFHMLIYSICRFFARTTRASPTPPKKNAIARYYQVRGFLRKICKSVEVTFCSLARFVRHEKSYFFCFFIFFGVICI